MVELEAPVPPTGSLTPLPTWRLVYYALVWGVLTSMFTMLGAVASIGGTTPIGPVVEPKVMGAFIAGNFAGILFLHLCGERWRTGVTGAALVIFGAMIFRDGEPDLLLWGTPVLIAVLHARQPRRYRYWLVGFPLVALLIFVLHPYESAMSRWVDLASR
ncbi:hypothetical protein SAMN04488242_0385 [Tessaracoccus oleiagri]|uniref:Uncharacterized protein n=2 Tax=Tessaracoccus oleiagri TaxID=686624 RepID=A0A1G9HL75_9ACTN|nr:hypothetical protein SAMN04488242_0385 [Tessaracoccus oleiagri]